jgi:hypothetical protein
MDLKNHIQQNRAALFDWTVILTSFLLGFIFPTISEFIASPSFHGMMLAVLLVYTAGAALKHLPLSYRLSQSSKTIRPIPYTFFLVVGHWFIFFIVTIVAEPAFRSIVGLPAATKENTMRGWSLLISSLLAACITWLVYRSKTKRQPEKEYTATHFRQEVVADILLTTSVAVLSFLFWEKGVMAMLERAKTENFGDIWFLFFFLCILFVFFYLPLRYLYFIEDREGGRNRRRLLLIFAFMLIRAIFRMLGI